MNKNGVKGFTLVELLVVLVIVAILGTLSMVAFAGARKTSRDQKRKADLEQIRSALEIYRSDCLLYPASWNLTSALTGCPGNPVTTYMSTVPSDPGSYAYKYTNLGANSYCLCAKLEMGGIGVALACVTGCGAGACGSGITCDYSVTNP